MASSTAAALGLLCVAWCAALGACQSGGSPPKEAMEGSAAAVSGPKPVTASAKAPAPVAQASTPPSELRAEKFTVHTPRTMVYDGGDGKTVTVVQDALPDCHCAGRTWWVRTFSGDVHGTPDREVKMVIDASGYIAASEEIDHLDKVEIEYQPPLVLIPDKLPPESQGGASYTQDVKMIVHPMGDRTRVKTSGKAHNVITYLGDEEITTGAGTFTARKIVATLTADLSAARTLDENDQWLVDGVGIVCQREHEETKVLVAKIRNNTTTMVLKSYEGGK